MSEIGDWERVGGLGVDAGLVWLGDPCYIKDGVPWDSVLEQRADAKEHSQGVCVSSGLGDGYYDVFVRRVTLPFWGKRIAEVKVVFISEEDLSERPDHEHDR